MSEGKTIDVNNATKAELLAYARDELGLEAKDAMSKDDLKDLVAKQLGDSVNADNSGAAEPDQLVTKNQRELRKQKKVRIRIFENPEHPPRIFVSVNGVDFTIKPGAVVEVPESVVGVLRDAMQTKYSQVRDENSGRIRTVTQQSRAYDFEVLN